MNKGNMFFFKYLSFSNSFSTIDYSNLPIKILKATSMDTLMIITFTFLFGVIILCVSKSSITVLVNVSLIYCSKYLD